MEKEEEGGNWRSNKKSSLTRYATKYFFLTHSKYECFLFSLFTGGISTRERRRYVSVNSGDFFLNISFLFLGKAISISAYIGKLKLLHNVRICILRLCFAICFSKCYDQWRNRKIKALEKKKPQSCIVVHVTIPVVKAKKDTKQNPACSTFGPSLELFSLVQGLAAAAAAAAPVTQR